MRRIWFLPMAVLLFCACTETIPASDELTCDNLNTCFLDAGIEGTCWKGECCPSSMLWDFTDERAVCASDCDDKDPCTVDSIEEWTTCRHYPIEGCADQCSQSAGCIEQPNGTACCVNGTAGVCTNWLCIWCDVDEGVCRIMK